ncbi:MAG: acetate/propionate family kinase, partial [Bryobacteraceae bacterium]
GLTPTAGLMMGTRTGDLDPGALFYLMNEKGYDPAGLAHLINEESGLLGVSAITSDMKRLIDASSNDARAEQAIELFCYLARKQIGAMAAALGDLDLLVFTGGIGERAAPVRERICSGLGFLGIELDAARNGRHADVISRDSARCAVRVIPTNEDLMIARHTCQIAFGAP